MMPLPPVIKNPGKLSGTGMDMKLDGMGSGSDYSAFIQHAGIPSLNLGYGGEGGGGEYHSIYDSYDFYVKFYDPGFQFGIALAETHRPCDSQDVGADELPFDFTHLYTTIERYSEELMSLLENKREKSNLENRIIRAGGYETGQDPTKGYAVPETVPEVPYLDFSPLQNALALLKTSVDSLRSACEKHTEEGTVSAAFNSALYRAEQQLLNDEGLPRRPWYKHILYAPGYYTGYSVKTMPGIREAIEEGNWDEARDQIEIAAKTLERLAGYFKTLGAT